MRGPGAARGRRPESEKFVLQANSEHPSEYLHAGTPLVRGSCPDKRGHGCPRGCEAKKVVPHKNVSVPPQDMLCGVHIAQRRWRCCSSGRCQSLVQVADYRSRSASASRLVGSMRQKLASLRNSKIHEPRQSSLHRSEIVPSECSSSQDRADARRATLASLALAPFHRNLDDPQTTPYYSSSSPGPGLAPLPHVSFTPSCCAIDVAAWGRTPKSGAPAYPRYCPDMPRRPQVAPQRPVCRARRCRMSLPVARSGAEWREE